MLLDAGYHMGLGWNAWNFNFSSLCMHPWLTQVEPRIFAVWGVLPGCESGGLQTCWGLYSCVCCVELLRCCTWLLLFLLQRMSLFPTAGAHHLSCRADQGNVTLFEVKAAAISWEACSQIGNPLQTEEVGPPKPPRFGVCFNLADRERTEGI